MTPLGPIPLYITEPKETLFERLRADAQFSPLGLVTDVLRLRHLEATREALVAEQRQLAARAVSGPVVASDFVAAPIPRQGFGWRDAFKLAGTALLLIGIVGRVLASTTGKTRSRIAVVALVLGATWFVLVLTTLLQIRANVQSATGTLRQIETMVSNPVGANSNLEAIARNAEVANTKIQQANDSASAVWMRILYQVPGLQLVQQSGRHTLQTAASGAALATEMMSHAQVAQSALEADPAARRHVANELQRQLRDITRRIDALDLPPRQWLPSRLHNEFDELETALRKAQDGAADLNLAVDVAVDVLNTDGQWLLIGGSTADSRMSMGAFLAASALTVTSGEVRVDTLSDTNNELDLGSKPAQQIDADITRNFGAVSGNQRWPTIGYSPRFAPAAKAAAQLWEQETGEDVRGVIYVDSVAIAELAGAVAPIAHDGQAYNRDEVRAELLRGQYESNLNGNSANDLGTQLAASVLSKVLASSDVLAISRVFASAVEDRHVMVWSDAPEIREPIRHLALDGPIGPSSLGVSLASLSGKWGDWTNLAVDVTSSCSTEQGLELDLAVTIQLEEVPEDLVPISRSQIWNEPLEHFVGLVAVTLPAAATSDTSGLGVLAVGESPDGNSRMASAFVRLAPGEKATLTVQVLLPRTAEIPLMASGRSRPTLWSHNDAPPVVANRLLTCPSLS